MERACVFIDGGNFYRGMKEARLPATGLNYDSFSRKLLQHRQWLETRFYIGKLRQEGNKNLYREQRKFLSRMEKYAPSVKVFLGRMAKRDSEAAQALDRWLRDRDVPISSLAEDALWKIVDRWKSRWVEKAVDVMIAVDMVSMAIEDKYDTAYLMSADGDFAPAITKAREKGKTVFVASPIYRSQIASAANAFIHLKKESFHGCWE